MTRLVRPLVSVLVALSLASCGASDVVLSVEVQTDLAPAVEFASIRVDVTRVDPSEDDPRDPRFSYVVDPEDAFGEGVEIVNLDVPKGRHTITVVLLDREGTSVARRTIEVNILDAYVLTVVIDRGCLRVSCPGDGDDPDATECLAGECVTEACAEDPSTCGRSCAADEECDVRAACAVGRCVEGRCLSVAREPGTEGACGAGMICHPVDGCVAPDRCAAGESRACELSSGVCASAFTACRGGTFEACDASEYGPFWEDEESRCDGLDNDCDDRVDELEPPSCPLSEGVCAGSAQRCGGGLGWLACDYAAHDPRYEPVEATCDGADNDCDGSTDEGRTPTCPLQDGVCRGARATCADGRLGCDAAEYGPSYEALEASCDGLDNDCDRLVDEALIPPACALTQGVCAGTVQRCGGAAGFLACAAADYGPSYEADETRCDGLDNDCDGVIDEGITRACDRGCGEGVETCVAGAFVGCDAPERVTLGDVTLGTGRYEWRCLDVLEEAEVTFGPSTTVVVTRDLVVDVDAVVTFQGAGGRLEVGDLTVRRRASVVAGDLDVDATGTVTFERDTVIGGIGLYSGGGGGACSALHARGVSAGGGGGANGGPGGRGGGCEEVPGTPGAPGIGVGAEGAPGCDCTCSIVALGASSIGGAGAAAPAGSGGGGGVGGRGGAGGAGAMSTVGWSVEGGPGGSAAHTGSEAPTVGGAGGGGGGGELGQTGAASCAPAGGNGGGRIAIQAARLVNVGRIAVDGAAGMESRHRVRHGATGGGGGGSVVVRVDTLDNQGSITASGGPGGGAFHAGSSGCADTTGGGAGGGGGGQVWIDAATVEPGSLGRMTVGGGARGESDCGSPGLGGAAGRVCCVSSVAGCDPC